MGKFDLRLEFERFLCRCPELRSLNEFSKVEVMFTEDYVVSLIAQLFLHPDYTIPLLGCLRCIAKSIVDKAVGLLRLVPNLRSNSDQVASKIQIITGDNVIRVIDFYVGCGRGLHLHQLACFAFCRALDLVPHLLQSVLSYFEFAPPSFQCFLNLPSCYSLPEKEFSDFLIACRVSYRFLLMEPECFSKVWNWSCFMDFFRNVRVASVSENNIVDIKWCGLQSMSIVLKTNIPALNVFDIGEYVSFQCWLRWREFCKDVSLEKASWYLEASHEETLNHVNGRINECHGDYLHSKAFNSSIPSSIISEPSLRTRRLLEHDTANISDPFTLTSNIRRCYDMVQLAINQRQPVLLYGPHGAGKTALISKLASNSGNRVLYVHIDDQIDGKMLVGGYVCGEQPGEFRWKPGSLTLAVAYGFWIVFENIDHASPDTISVLLPLLEGSTSFLTSQGEKIKVAEGFRLFSTITGLRLDLSHYANGIASLVHWEKFMVASPLQQDLHDIIRTWYPHLEPLTERLVQTFERVIYVSLHQHGGAEFVKFSVRDLLKWCKRLAGVSCGLAQPSLSPSLCRVIYQEAVDVFAASFASQEYYLYMMNEIGSIWGVQISSTEQISPRHKPSIEESISKLTIGRVSLQRSPTVYNDREKPFVELPSTVIILERIASSVKYNEPVLLVGETGTGKTTIVQNLASRLGKKLTVLNLSQQSDISDLLGGYKPVDARFMCVPLFNEFEDLFSMTYSVQRNIHFLRRLQQHLCDKKWKSLLNGFQKFVEHFRKSLAFGTDNMIKKRKKPMGEEIIKSWDDFSLKVESLRNQISSASGTVFSFVEGSFIIALRRGEWILLDEVNLAPPETLQRLAAVLEGERGSLCLAERGDSDYIGRHPNFRMFACMNPATDAGKRDLPNYLQCRFSEYYVPQILDDEDLSLFVKQVLGDGFSNQELICKIVRFYKAAKEASDTKLQDGANQRPQYSLRSLLHAIEYMKKARKKFGPHKSLYDGFCIFFLTLLDKPSAKIMNQMISSHLLGGSIPTQQPFDAYITTVSNSSFHNFVESYVLTTSVKDNLRRLACAVFIKKYPVLLQGPTSSGKTSLVHFLSAITGHEFVRINNHEHTDIQDYLGSYVVDSSGRLVFHEGVLVRAVRNGYWIVLDELNLAPSDVLEALNRLLDDNRELFVPELCETVCAHENFMLFATQNPPNFYGGRKVLSRAFRNRFVEIHVDDLPEDEMVTILERRCKIPLSHAEKMVGVMRELQLHRQHSKVFAGKHGFITPRDLFRWANRFRCFGNSYLDLARDGYFLLAERLRDESEKSVVQEVLEKHLRVTLVRDDLYKHDLSGDDGVHSYGGVTWTKSMQRLYFLLERCYKMQEPVLLVGETGGGKTTVCQLLSVALKSDLRILNCHHYSETSDFLGGFYPMRERSKLASDFQHLVEMLKLSKIFVHFRGQENISVDITQASQVIGELSAMLSSCRQCVGSCSGITRDDLIIFEQMFVELHQLSHKWQKFFLWHDGPLVQAMKDGSLFLIDEISLADDSVLERLNSVLEPEREVFLAEKGGSEQEKVVAHLGFCLLATMNPGGDFGKKELSPALRNRFTEIWVPPVSDMDELRSIALERLMDVEASKIVDPLMNFWAWFNGLNLGRLLTIRDLLSWIDFVKECSSSLHPELSFLHGAFLILLDGISLGTGLSIEKSSVLRDRCFSFLLEQVKNVADPVLFRSKLSRLESYGWGDFETIADISSCSYVQHSGIFGIEPFYIKNGNDGFDTEGFEFLAPTTRRNALRVLRAMQLSKPVLLEGSPGVGKTSLIVALGKYSGHKVLRINLSEQTDMMDLLGSDLPVESDQGLKFSWSDGILLQAIKSGYWVLLDELNLAPQSVLEGLNAILDHRSEVFVPELNCTFKCPSSFRVFACQNPSYQGGGRRGLPRSFLNRFTKVYLDELIDDDYLHICSSFFPSIPKSIIIKLVAFNKKMHEETMVLRNFGQDGSPWEFNLRDVIRSCSLIQCASKKSSSSCFLNIVYVQRMRTINDRRKVLTIYEQVFGIKPFINPYPRVQLSPSYVMVGNTSLKRSNNMPHKVPNSKINILPEICLNLEAVAQCVERQWLCILVGPSGSGKTSLLRVLAQITGNVLNELILSPATDISDLLGCFEQYSAFRHLQNIVAVVEGYVNKFCVHVESSTEEVLCRQKFILGKWIAFSSCTNINFVTSSPSICEEFQKNVFGSLYLLVEIIEHLQLVPKERNICLPWSDDLCVILKVVQKLQEDYQRRPFSAKFEWVGGLLVKAIENGEWVILENANLCNPAVLDRINSLVEPCGTIVINECGNVNGEPLVLHPHPNFRMFFTVNSYHGEVSRAMRNRGVEIFLMPPYWLLEKESENSIEEAEVKDLKRFLFLYGIPVGELASIMVKAHIYAKNVSLCMNRNVTQRELAHWVRLFHQLIASGNKPLWSLQMSYEHTYISSLSEEDALGIVTQAKTSYFTGNQFAKIRDIPGSLCLPGGWPLPLKLHDFVCSSRAASVYQNCMYLEFMGSQYASIEFLAAQRSVGSRASNGTNCMRLHLMCMKSLSETMFPNASGRSVPGCGSPAVFDMVLTRHMLYFIASWTFEQATKVDVELYLIWFSWFNSQLQPYCPILNSFVALLDEELKHPVWNYILQCHRELLSTYGVDFDAHPIPMLSLELASSYAPSDISESALHLPNAIKSVSLLRSTLHQWHTEKEYHFDDQNDHFKSLLRSLHMLEETILDVLVKSLDFNVCIQMYDELLQLHKLLWERVSSYQFENFSVIWCLLMKNIKKWKLFFPKIVDIFLEDNRIMDGLCCWPSIQKSILWVHGGHPHIPCSSDVCYKQNQLLNLCESIWPEKAKASEQENISTSVTNASFNYELRLLAAEGISMALHMVQKNGETDTHHIIQQLEDVYQILVERFKHEKDNSESNVGTYKDFWGIDLADCCNIPKSLAAKLGFDGLLGMLAINDVTSFFLNMKLLEMLTRSVLIGLDRDPDLKSELSKFLTHTYEFSLAYTSRSPAKFFPHQKLIWALDAPASHDYKSLRIVAGFVLEMWFKWHSTLWHHPGAAAGNCGTSLPRMLFRPVKLVTTALLLRSPFSIKDCSIQSLKLRVALRDLWLCLVPEVGSFECLTSCARLLLCQIIYTHKKSFDTDKYLVITSELSTFESKIITERDIDYVVSLIASSSHEVLKSLTYSFIKPAIKELYTSRGSLYDLGFAWLRIGVLRLQLLVSCNDFDPAMKHSLKCFLLSEKISSLKLEVEMRKECEHLSGRVVSQDSDEERKESLAKFESEFRRLQKKVVFRAHPEKFRMLKCECDELLQFATSMFGLLNRVFSTDLQQVAAQIATWLETADRYIERLADEYGGYTDIIMPVQVGVYEMKLGLSLLLSSIYLKDFLLLADESDMDRIVGTIYSLMSFPRRSINKHANLETIDTSSSFSQLNIVFPENSWMMDLSLLDKLVAVSDDAASENACQRASLLLSFLVRIAHYIADAGLFDKASFSVLGKLFDEFSSLWFSMKIKTKDLEDSENQFYKFKPRRFDVESILGVDESSFGDSSENGEFFEWKKSLSENECNEVEESHVKHVIESEDLMGYMISDSVVCIHNQLFGSKNLVESPGTLRISDTDRLQSFIDSYNLGVSIIKDLGGLFSTTLDSKLLPEHVLRLCLENDTISGTSHNSAPLCNFYKDANIHMLEKMARALTGLKQQVLIILKEWEDHPGLKKILCINEMLLDLHPRTPLAKALPGLQFLLHTVWQVLENCPKLALSQQLDPVVTLISSWHKLELDSWPAIFDEIHRQCEINAGKLWFPLYSVLHERSSTDITASDPVIVHILEEFIQTSNTGEFKKRLELLFAFQIQIQTGVDLGSYSGTSYKEILNILYNTFGFYMQFAPIVEKHIEDKRRMVEMELKEFVKLCSWKCSDRYSLKSERWNSRKLKRIIQKYNDVLQQPFFMIVQQEASPERVKTCNKVDTRSLYDFSGKTDGILSAVFEQTQVGDKHNFVHLSGWSEKSGLALEFFNLSSKIPISHNGYEEIKCDIIQRISSMSSKVVFEQEYTAVWFTLEKICGSVMDCRAMWKADNKSMRKRRALSELLKLLESCGLSRHKPMCAEQSTWFHQPSYNANHLLLPHSEISSAKSVQLENLACECVDNDWKMANHYYFKSVSAVQFLQEVCLDFHKDFTLEQVNRSLSFVNQLIVIQQEQRAAAYAFAENLRKLKNCMRSLVRCFGPSTGDQQIIHEARLTPHQHIAVRCLLQQKQLFDDLYVTLYEERLLLRSLDSSHYEGCANVKAAARELFVFIDRFVETFHNTKDLLDNYLIGIDGVTGVAFSLLHTCIVSEQMESAIRRNFNSLKEFEKQLGSFRSQELCCISVYGVLLSHIDDIIEKGDALEEEFVTAINTEAGSSPHKQNEGDDGCNCQLLQCYDNSVRELLLDLRNVFREDLWTSKSLLEEPIGKLTSWKVLFDSYTANLQLCSVHDKLSRTISYAIELVNCSDNSFLHVGLHLKHIYLLVGLLLNIGDGLMQEFLAMKESLSMLTVALTDAFVFLYSQGYGGGSEDVDKVSGEISQEAKGTGLGEGTGTEDVSNQINDEDQILGASNGPGNEEDEDGNVPSQNCKGIEMEEDFSATAVNLSEDSEEDNDVNDDENDEPDSTMGEMDDDGEIVKEKLWDKNDGSSDNRKEKYESGPAVPDKISDKEIRAQDDASVRADGDEDVDFDDRSEKDETQDVEDSGEMEDLKMEKEDAYMDPTGINPDNLAQYSEDERDLGEERDGDGENTDKENSKESADVENENENENEGKSVSNDGIVEEVSMNSGNEENVEENDHESSAIDSLNSKRNVEEPREPQCGTENKSNLESAVQNSANLQPSELRNLEREGNCFNGDKNSVCDDLAPVKDLPVGSTSDMEIMVEGNGRNLREKPPASELLKQDSVSASTKLEANPYRNVGNFLEGWKKRAKVSLDIQEQSSDIPENALDEDASEYGYVLNSENGTAQALGSATLDQIDCNMNIRKRDDDFPSSHEEDTLDMEIENSEICRTGCSSNISRQVGDTSDPEGIEKRVEKWSTLIRGDNDCEEKEVRESLVALRRCNVREEILHLEKPFLNSREPIHTDYASYEMKNNSTDLWRKYEFLTTRPSIELAEQLRLIMEPTLASKLQGDYKTGKRINMKKVITYVASLFRKDKIWLRRTRPNKRDYQVIIAVDDSRSMSESQCGHVAVEALVTVCRAMSLLEVGNFAVASFGKAGNVRLLHDFDHTFTTETGVNMVSSLSFEQENTIVDEPVLDLLNYLNNFLDKAVGKVRLPSGMTNPLEQLILIIADGNFHEKEKLNYCMREFMGKKRLVVFLILDSPEESIVDRSEVLFEGGSIKISKYLDSFPFPYYVVLRKIEELPRTLADLLRQWFELVQVARD